MTAALPKKILHVSAKWQVNPQHESLDSNDSQTLDFVHLVVVSVGNMTNL